MITSSDQDRSPDSLRAGFRPHDWDEASKYAEVACLYDNVVRPHADAWEAERRRLKEFSSENVTLRSDNAALREREKQMTADHMATIYDNAALREALRMLTFSPDGLPDEWPSPKIVAAALASQEVKP